MRGGSRAAAARITVERAPRPRSSSSNASAAWCTSMPEPVGGTDPAGAGGGEKRRLHRVVHGVDHELPGVETFHGQSVPPPPASRAAWRSPPGRTRPGSTLGRAGSPRPPGTRPAAESAASRRRAATVTRAPAPARASTMARAAPPAPSDEHVRARGVEAFVAHRPQEALTVGRRAEQAAVGLDGHDVRPTPSAAASGVRSSQAQAASALCGMVTLRPAEAERARRRHRLRAAARAAPGTPRRPSRGRLAANAALWIAGERECATGSPMTPGRPVGRAVESLIRPAPRAARMFASCSASVVGEVRDAILAGHVEEVGDVGGRERGAQRLLGDGHDRRRREPGHPVGVVRRVDLLVGVGRHRRAAALRVAERGVDLQRHALPQPVDDHRGDLGRVGGGARLAPGSATRR